MDATAHQQFSIGELMAVTIARAMESHDGDWIAVGAYSQLPMAAVKLARLLYAPNIWWLAGGGGAINGTGKIVDSTSDQRTLIGAEYVMDMEALIDMEVWRFKHKNPRTVAIVGGMQIDQHGSSNMVCIGDYQKQRVRGVGTVGLCFGVSFNTTHFYTMHHSRHTFVPKVDFVSSPGFTERRAQFADPEAEGPRTVFTPLGVFDFAPDTKCMRIQSLHPGVTLEEVQDKTGFPLIVPDQVLATRPPEPEELAALREMDPDGVLERLRITR